MKHYQLVYNPLVPDDIQVAFDWYENQQRGLGDNFLDSFFSTIAIIKDNPLIYQIALGDYRKVTLKKFLYHVYYRIHQQHIVILGVFRGAKDPKQTITAISQR